MLIKDRPTCRMIRDTISCGARKIDKKMLTFLEFPRSNAAGTLPVIHKHQQQDYVVNCIGYRQSDNIYNVSNLALFPTK
jgi:hypothetical protein